MGGYGADWASNAKQNTIEEKAKLFEYLMKNMTMTSDRSPGGKLTLTWVTSGKGHSGDAEKILKYHNNYSDKRSREERYDDFLRLREEFEGEK